MEVVRKIHCAASTGLRAGLAMRTDPVGNATPNTAERSTLPERADLPLQRRRNIGKTRIFRTTDICKVCWHVDGNLETVCNACAKARTCAVHKSIAVSRADVDAVLPAGTNGSDFFQ